MTNAVVMNADDVLDQSTERCIQRIACQATTFFNLRISKFFENLIDGELQLLARGFERQVCLNAQIDIESMKDAWLRMACWLRSRG